ISNMAHYLHQGKVVGHGPTAREISYLSTLFDNVRHVGCLHAGDAPALMLPYASDRVTLVPLPPTGGATLGEKLRILRNVPLYLSTIARELGHADVVHVRCPANIPLIAVILLALRMSPQKRWIKYAGNWNPDGREAWSYTFQRWWLRRNFARAKVTVNGEWENQPHHIHTFFNPCLTDKEIQEAQQAASDREFTTPLRLLFVGNLNTPKGVGRALEILAQLQKIGIDATLDLIGDGEERQSFENQAEQLGIKDLVIFRGWVPRTALGEYYRNAHFLLFPSGSEGWPKVISEAMAYGVVPIASAVSSIPQYLAQFGVGKAIPPTAVKQFVDAIQEYFRNPQSWRVESQKAQQAAELFTYRRYLERVKVLLEL
ncbi:partial Lipopolysaccharide 1,6-galactosyltransferase, partial [Anaerolineae bacterium]